MKKEPEVSIQMSDDSTNRPATASSRRDVLRMTGAAGAAVTLGALAGQAISSPGLAASRPSPDEESRRNFDVIIIGAGFAGVTAARELGARGKRVLLLEARDRIGGRTWTDTFRGERIERGGAWVDPRQPHIWRELIRYRIPIVAETGPERAILPTLNGFKEYDPVEAYARQAELFTPYFDGAREYFERPYQPLFREDLLRDLDRYSLRDRLDQLNYPPEDEIRLTSTLALYGGSSERGAMTHLAQWWALAGWTYEDFHAVNTYRPADGTIAILQSILADSHAKLVLNSPVASVTQNQSRVQVATRAGRQYEAPEVIMAVPVNVWKTIEFSPPLPDPHSEATTAGIGVPHEKKLWLDLGNPDDRFIAEAPEGFPICIMGRLNDDQLAVAFSVEETFDAHDPRQVVEAVRRIIPDAKVLDYTATDWHADEFALGVGAFRQPFQLTKLHRDIQRPHGRIKFATADIADGWSGYIDGAVEAGLRVAESDTWTNDQADAVQVPPDFEIPAVNHHIYRSLWKF